MATVTVEELLSKAQDIINQVRNGDMFSFVGKAKLQELNVIAEENGLTFKVDPNDVFTSSKKSERINEYQYNTVEGGGDDESSSSEEYEDEEESSY